MPESAKQGGLAEVAYASWGRRLAAWLLDFDVLLAVAVLLARIVWGSESEQEPMAVIGAAVIVLLAMMPIWFVYFAVLNGRGQTLGKRLLSIKVVDAETGVEIGDRRGVVRELTRLPFLVFWPLLLIDGLRPLWTEKHQSWQDDAARSIVVRAPSK